MSTETQRQTSVPTQPLVKLTRLIYFRNWGITAVSHRHTAARGSLIFLPGVISTEPRSELPSHHPAAYFVNRAVVQGSAKEVLE